jgi:hypothetical protein
VSKDRSSVHPEDEGSMVLRIIRVLHLCVELRAGGPRLEIFIAVKIWTLAICWLFE